MQRRGSDPAAASGWVSLQRHPHQKLAAHRFHPDRWETRRRPPGWGWTCGRSWGSLWGWAGPLSCPEACARWPPSQKRWPPSASAPTSLPLWLFWPRGLRVSCWPCSTPWRKPGPPAEEEARWWWGGSRWGGRCQKKTLRPGWCWCQPALCTSRRRSTGPGRAGSGAAGVAAREPSWQQGFYLEPPCLIKNPTIYIKKLQRCLDKEANQKFSKSKDFPNPWGRSNRQGKVTEGLSIIWVSI